MKSSSATVLELLNVKKGFPVRSPFLRRTVGRIRAVDDVSFSVGAGETVGLVGESGSGKSTVGRLALRLTDPDSGSVFLDGRDITRASRAQMRALRRQMQMVFQDPYSSLDPHATIEDSLGEPLRTHFGIRGKDRTDRVRALLDRVRLNQNYMRCHPHELSGGQLQRVALGAALAVDPKIIVADEPVSSLDVSTQAQVLELLEELHDELGIAYLFVSHDLSVVHHISSRIVVMHLGRVVEIGDTDDVVRSPKHPYTQALLSAVPIPDPTARRRERIVLKGDVPSPANPPAGCPFHTRCQHVMDICRTVDPPAADVGNGAVVYCHLYPPAGAAQEPSFAMPRFQPVAVREGRLADEIV